MTVNAPNIAVLVATSNPQRRAIASDLAKRLGAAMADESTESDADLFLAVTDDRVELRDRTPRTKGVAVDLGQFDARTLAGRGSRDMPIVRAFGADVHTVVDATAGLGQDSALLACMGFQVTAMERSAVIAALLQDGLRRATEDERWRNRFIGRLELVHADAREMLRRMDPRPDAVYIDPMFPPKRKKSALPSRSIRLVRAVVGDDEDAADLFQVALATAAKRVVVKRPNHAPPLHDNPATSYKGKLARFDVYRL
jgi:16S rRNA (guanine1516-N2)-methyltransferase